MELKQYWNVIVKRLWIVLVLVIVSAAVTGYYSYNMIEKRYAASSKLIVDSSQQLKVVGGNVDMGRIASSIQLAKTYKEIIRTPRIMKLVAEQHPELGLSAGQLVGMVSVATVNETQVMSIQAVDTSYSRAASVVNAVARVFQKEIPNIMKVDNVSILNEADPSAIAAPIAPRPMLNVMIAVIMSAMVGLALIFLLDYLGDDFKSARDVEQVLGLPAYGQIPKIRRSGAESRRNGSLKQPVRSGDNGAYKSV